MSVNQLENPDVGGAATVNAAWVLGMRDWVRVAGALSSAMHSLCM